MTITVILCTYNRCGSLKRALESIASMELHESIEWEVLVVDNNSSDQTREVVEAFQRLHSPIFRYLFEPRQGKSYALNAGIRDARGEILAFVDDDVTVEPTWLQNLTCALQTGEWSGSGGRVLLPGTFIAPPWLPMEGPFSLAGMLALFDLGDQAGELKEAPFGANMAFRKEIFAKYGGFRTDLGPCPGSEIRNEDTEFGRRLLNSGERLRYEPWAIVHHPVPESRLKREYFLAFWYDYGRASIRECGKRPDIMGIPRHYLTILKIGWLLVGRTIRWLVTPSARERFYYKGFTWMTAGEIVEVYHQHFRPTHQRAASVE